MEANKAHCKVCNQLKNKIESGRFPNGRSKRYVDEMGLQWSGRTCPECNRTRAQKTMKAGRLLNTNLEKLINED